MVKEFKLSKQERKLVSAGVQEARILRIIDRGLRPADDRSKRKDPVQSLKIVFEVSQDKINVDGIELPMTISSKMTFNTNEKSTLNRLRVAAGLPESFTLDQLIGKPVSLTIAHKPLPDGTKYSAVAGIAGLSDMVAAMVPPLVAKSYIFDFDNPDAELLKTFSEYAITDLKDALNYQGSALQKLIEQDEGIL